jgi:chromate reductase, NAD(P)H dehydrogenase (quinone)
VIRILAISGSLRAASSNSTLLRAARMLAPAGVEVVVYDRLGDLPHFNPDVDDAGAPPLVQGFRAQLKAADAVLISSPEYAHGVPGVLKDALDWLVGTGEFVGKLTALVDAAPRAAFAHASLTETLTVMMARMVPEASPSITLTGKKLDDAGMAADPEIAAPMRAALAALARAV